MRVGKTPTHLNEAALLRRDFDTRWHIVLAPNAFKPDWPLEAEKFGYPADAIAMDSSNRKQVQRFIDGHQKLGGMIAVNYEALGSDANLALLDQIVDGCLIGADESISIKNNKSGYSRAALALSKRAAFRRIMSGKPITQGAHDLYMQLRFIGLLNGIEFTVFRNTYCAMGGFMGKQIVGIKNEDQLHSILDANAFRGRKIDWLKTPGRDYFERRLQLLPDQQRLYDQMQQDFLVELGDGTIVSADQVITKLMKMQQISSGFIIDEEGKVNELVTVDRNPKAAEVKRALEQDLDTKLIVVCHYQHSLNILERALAEFQPAVIRGDQWHTKNGRDKISEKARFNGDRGCRVLLGQERALCYGHTLMGNRDDPCFTTFFYENNYSLNDRSQCEERNQGDGQQSPIAIMDFISTQQDLSVIRSLQRKEDVASTLLQYAREQGVLPRAAAD
jgi:hypothetical protein